MTQQNLSTARQTAEYAVTLWRAKDRRIVISLDGRSGSGKTEMARAMRAIINEPTHSSYPRPQASIVALDSIYPGWSGIEAAIDLLSLHVLQPWHQHRPAAYPVFDWKAMVFDSTCAVPEADILIVEGCGAGAKRLATQFDLLLWLEAPSTLRRQRALRRDGEAFTPWWEHWAAQEDLHYATNQTRARADFIVDTTR